MSVILTAQQVVDQFCRFRYETDVKFTVTLGPEIECFVYDQNHNPVDLTQYYDIITHIPYVWLSGTDLGKNMLELSCDAHHSLMDYCRAVRKAFTYLAERTPSNTWVFEFSGTALKTCGRVKGDPYDTKIRALRKENPERGKFTEKCMTEHAAFQVNIGVSRLGGAFSNDSKKLMFAFTNWAPALAVYFEGLSGDANSDRLPHAYKFTSDIRGPAYKTWEFCDNIKEELFRVPQLMRQKSNGKWVVHGEPPTSFNIIHTGGIFWIVRPQGINDKGAARMEIRALSSMSPLHGAYALRFINQLIVYILNTRVQDLPLLSEAEWLVCMGYTPYPLSHAERRKVAQESLLQKLPVSLLWSV